MAKYRQGHGSSRFVFIRDKGGSRGRVQGVRTPLPRDDLRFSNTTGILPKKNVVYWC